MDLSEPWLSVHRIKRELNCFGIQLSKAFLKRESDISYAVH
jgi:hypothetical protein